MTDSSNSSKRIGNTKQSSPSKHWCFTLNNHTNEDIEMIKNIDRSIVPTYVFQEETGENGTPHLQGYLCFKTKKRPMSVFGKTNKIHWEKCKNIKASIDYCQKIDTRTGQIFKRGLPVCYVKEIDSFYDWQEKIIELLKEKPDDRSVHWYWENKGCRGKTTFCKYVYTHFEKVIVVSGKGADMKNAIIEYEKHNKCLPEIVLINIPRSSNDFISYTGIEEIKDMFFFSGKYEGGMVCGENPHVICFANNIPKLDKMSMDRWQLEEISE